MDCTVIQSELVSYHFGTIDEQARTNVEAHLTTCRECLADFIALKRDIETAVDRPSRIAKQRLKNAVQRELASHRRPAFSFWERPLAIGVATIAVAAAMFAMRVVATTAVAPPHGLAASIR